MFCMAPRGRHTTISHPAFTLVELLVTLAIVALLASLAATALPGLIQRADRADALSKTRTMGIAVLQYAPDHGGLLPPLFPGQVLEFKPDRRGRIVTECRAYLGLDKVKGDFLVKSLFPRAYLRQRKAGDLSEMRIYVMNSAISNGTSDPIKPFGGITNRQVDGKTLPLAAVTTRPGLWMIQNADQQQPQVAGAIWKTNTPPQPPLGDQRAVFRFDGSAGLVNINTP
jgi:prepilin-type N-terminal cleavage/methylation domain-containing protein